MTQKIVAAVPQGFTTITPFLGLNNPAQFIEFAQNALGAQVTHSTKDPDTGELWHAQLLIGNARLMVGSPMGQPETPGNLYLYLDNPDAAYKKAIDAGATSVSPVTDQFYGDRSGGVKDKFGNFWWFSKRIEEVSPTEMDKRIREQKTKHGKEAA